MAKHLWVCGHGQADPGAVGHGINERDWTRNPLMVAAQKYARQLKRNSVDFYDPSKDMFQQSCAGWGAYSVSTSYASVTEYHLDAASPAATGGHVIISTGMNPDGNDLAIANVVRKYAGWWGGVANSQGINRRNNLLNLNVFAKRGISYRLVELGFISNQRDTDILKANYDKLAKELIEAMTGEGLGGTGSVVTPQEPEKPKRKKEITMVCTYEYEGSGAIYYFDGKDITILAHPHERQVLQDIYRANNDKEMPHFVWKKQAPWNARLEAVAKRKVLPNKNA